MRAKLISSLEKCFWNQTVPDFPTLGSISLFQNERYSFQICYDTAEPVRDKTVVFLSVDSPLAEYISIYKVKSIPSQLPRYRNSYDDNYLSGEAGLYPDLLEPLREHDRLTAGNTLSALWFALEPNGKVPAGIYPIIFRFTDEAGNTAAELSTQAEIIGAMLPEQELIFTQWFYTDCLMGYYGTEAFDERHWEIIERFMENAHKYGMNMILTPVLTPPLDTYVGGERPTTQLVGITLDHGVYSFDFSKLGRWVDLCDKVGIRYLEISHFFTQWGAQACPKVMATVDGQTKRIFGWDTPSAGEEYEAFLKALIPQLLRYLKEEKNGADRRCRFHLSDEPNGEHLEQYRKVSEILKPLIAGYPTMDALSHYDFYEQGLIDCPIPSCDCIEPFLEHEVPDLWTYYCCGQTVDVPNRFFDMPSARNRIIGTQFYKFRIAGFLHWGYNFYNSQFSYAEINPFLCSDAECFSPSGDAYSVYPGTGGQPWPSLRQVVFAEALQDLRALKLCESLVGREATMRLLEEGIAPITFRHYPKDADYLLNLRRRVNQTVKEALQK